jgi:hypothetical protein
MDGVAGFAVYHLLDCNIGFWMRRSASVFTAELAAIRMAMDHNEHEALESYLILTGQWNHEKSRSIPIRVCSIVNRNAGS